MSASEGMSEERLKKLQRIYALTGFYGPEGQEMLGEIDRLRSEVERLKHEVIIWRDNFNSEEVWRKQLAERTRILSGDNVALGIVISQIGKERDALWARVKQLELALELVAGSASPLCCEAIISERSRRKGDRG